MMTRLLLTVALLAFAACQAPRTQTGKAMPAPEPAATLDPKTPVARISGRVVTAGELDDAVKKELRKAHFEYQEKAYQTRKNGLDALIVKQLLEEKAKAAGITPDELVKREVMSKVKEPTDAEVGETYEKAKASGRQLPPIDQVKEQIVGFLKSQRAEEASRTYFDKLRADAKVETLLPPYQPPRVEIAAVGPSKGDANAPVTIVEFSDFQCPFCSRVEPTLERVLAEYKGKVRLVFRDYPLPFHAEAPKASEAALCADDQGRYWDMHGKLYANQQALAVSDLKGYAKELKLDGSKFEKCLDSGAKGKVVEENRKAGEEAGVSGTPAFFVNGRLISGAQPFEAFKQLIDAELNQK